MRGKFKNLSEADKEKIKKHQKNYREKKSKTIFQKNIKKMREYQKNYREKGNIHRNI